MDENWPDSWTAIQLMALGYPYSELGRLKKHARILGKLAGVSDRRFLSDAMLNLAKSPDGFREIHILDVLKNIVKEKGVDESQGDVALVNITTRFDDTISRIADVSIRGINPYLGNADPDDLTSFMCRGVGYLSGKQPNYQAAALIHGQMASLVDDMVSDAIYQYKREFLSSDEEIHAATLQETLKTPGAKTRFITGLGVLLSERKKKLAENAATIEKIYQEALPEFESDPVDAGTHQISMGDAFQFLSDANLTTKISIGLKKYERNELFRRIRSLTERICDLGLTEPKAMKIGVMVGIGDAENPDISWLAHVDKRNPMPYDVPAELDRKMKIMSLAGKITSANLDATNVGERIVATIQERKSLRSIGTRKEDLCLSVFKTLGTEIVARQRYGGKESALELYDELVNGKKKMPVPQP